MYIYICHVILNAQTGHCTYHRKAASAMNHMARRAVAALLGALLGALGFQPLANAVTNAAIPSYCNSAVAASVPSAQYHPFGAGIPILLVHGWAGKGKNQWGVFTKPDDFISKLDNINGASVAAEFEYTVSGIGGHDSSYDSHHLPMAYTIDCMAEISRRNGGPGKVIVIGYSEGAAIARRAAALTVNGRFVTNEIGQVVTIADASKLFGAGGLSGSIMVHAVAGNIVKDTYFNGSRLRYQDTQTDGTMTVGQATWQYSSDWSKGGGRSVVSCTSVYRYSTTPPYYEASRDDSCNHGNLLTNQRVQDATIAAVSRYAAFASPPPPPPPPPPAVRNWTLSTTLTLHLDSRWGELVSASMDPSLEGYANELGASRSLSGQYYRAWCQDTIQNCALGTDGYRQVTGAAPAVSIGGKAPDYSASYVSNAGQYAGAVWCFTSQGICLNYETTTSPLPLMPSQTLLDLFAGATWAP